MEGGLLANDYYMNLKKLGILTQLPSHSVIFGNTLYNFK